MIKILKNVTYVAFDLFLDSLLEANLLLLLGVALLLALAFVALYFVEMVVHDAILDLVFDG